MDRPVLVIKEKHKYNTQNPNTYIDADGEEQYYKVSQNTNIVGDIGEEINFLENMIRRQTKIHNKAKNIQDPDSVSAVYKIDGIEFLPENFIELDPLLLKDEYEFESKVHEKLFTEEQRKVKVLRRKQYDQRKKQKMREVQIYLLDEHKNKILDFLERWYFKNKRRLNDKEIGYVANLFQINPQDVERLQDAFLRQKKLNNLRSLNQYLTEKKSSMPLYMTKMLKGKNEYEDVQAKYMEPTNTYEPTILNKYQNKQYQKGKNKDKEKNKKMNKSGNIQNQQQKDIQQEFEGM